MRKAIADIPVSTRPPDGAAASRPAARIVCVALGLALALLALRIFGQL